MSAQENECRTRVISAPNDDIFLALSRYDGCSMNIRSAKVDQLAQRLARLTGEDVETALERAIEERLSRVAPPASADRKAAMDSFFERVSRMRVLDPRPADEIVGYDRSGLPS
jgi:antitoxin VapB